MRFSRVLILSAVIAASAGAAFLAGVARAQAQAPAAPPVKATINDPVGPLPDPTHIPMVLPENIKWTGQVGRQQTGTLFGDPSKPGLYGVVYKWYPGNFSQPHFHDQERYAYIISGTWWVSSSNVYDEKLTYPVRAGTVAIDTANTVHWDGSRTGEKEPAVLVLVGMGPVKTVQVDENGKPKPPAAPAK